VPNLLQQLGTSSANTTCRQLVNRFVTTCLQTCNNLCVFTRVLWRQLQHVRDSYDHMEIRMIGNQMISECVRTACSQLLTCLEQVVITLYQVVPSRLIQAVRNKLQRACCHQLVTCRRHQLLRVCWLHQPCYKMITTCSRLDNNCEQAVRTHVKTHKLLQVCKQVVTNLFTSCRQVVFALLVPGCCNKFGTSC
jgi:flagellar biosynthesis component FlhA